MWRGSDSSLPSGGKIYIYIHPLFLDGQQKVIICGDVKIAQTFNFLYHPSTPSLCVCVPSPSPPPVCVCSRYVEKQEPQEQVELLTSDEHVKVQALPIRLVSHQDPQALLLCLKKAGVQRHVPLIVVLCLGAV